MTKTALSSKAPALSERKNAHVNEMHCKSPVQNLSHASFVHSSSPTKSHVNSIVVKLIVLIACSMLLTCEPVDAARTRNYKNRNHRLSSSKKIKTKNSPIYYIKSNSFFNSRPLLTEMLMNSHTSSAALSTLSNSFSSSATHYTRMSPVPSASHSSSYSSSSSSSTSSSSSSSSSSSASHSRPLVVSTMYRLPIKYLSNAKPTEVYKGKNTISSVNVGECVNSRCLSFFLCASLQFLKRRTKTHFHRG